VRGPGMEFAEPTQNVVAPANGLGSPL